MHDGHGDGEVMSYSDDVIGVVPNRAVDLGFLIVTYNMRDPFMWLLGVS